MRRRAYVALAMVVAALAGASDAAAKSPAVCHPDDRPETGLSGQVPMADRASGRAAEGYSCGLVEVGSFASTSFANFDTYADCAYYSDTIGVPRAEGGTIVLDVSDPRKPVQTDYLTARAAKNAGESRRVNVRRGLLVADRYVLRGVGKLDEPETTRSLAVYDLKADCRKPKLLADVIMPSAVGHEGCFQPDGTVYCYTVRVVVRKRDGRKVTRVRRYRTCVPKPRSPQARVAMVDALETKRVAEQVLALCRLIT